MSLPPDAAPPGHLPAAAVAPWPIQPPPHGAVVPTIPVRPREQAQGIGTLAVALIGGAAAAAIGLAIAIPLLRQPAKSGKRRKKAGGKAKRAPARS